MPQQTKALDAIVGKTVAKVDARSASDELSIEIHFTDGTSFSILNNSIPSFDVFYNFGPADEQSIHTKLKGER